MPVQQILTLVPSAAGGVRDYNDLVSKALRIHGLRIEEIQPAELLQLKRLNGTVLLVQFSAYGFQKRGVPLHLLACVRRARSQGATVGIYFHELFAIGPFYTSSFWLSPVQKLIAARLAQMSDFWLTNRAQSARWLLSASPTRPHIVLPVCSNVGEAPEAARRRRLRLVVFGNPASRLDAYNAGDCTLLRWARHSGVEVHDVGAVMEGATRPKVDMSGVVYHGRKGPEEVSDLLREALYGAINYPAEFLGKSGILAAYAAHGVCPVLCRQHKPSAAEGLIEHKHYLTLDSLGTVPHEEAQAVGVAAHAWYSSHTVRAHAEAILSLSQVGHERRTLPF